MSLAFIGLGSNLGDGRKNLRNAWQAVGQSEGVTIIGLSSPYQSAPLGIDSDHMFTNAVGALYTTLQPQILLENILRIELEMGRDRSKGSDRTIDLDILYVDDLILQFPELVVPHPEISQRLFVLEPLEEIAPDHVHPILNLTTHAMKRQLLTDDGQYIKKISWSI